MPFMFPLFPFCYTEIVKPFFMYIKNYLFAAGLSLGMLPFAGNAQTIATFDDLTLPGADTNFANTQPQGAYSFQSGHVLFFGELTSWGGYSGFNCTNIQDDTTQSFTNDKSAITGIGFDSSANYGVCFVPLDFAGTDPTKTVPVGAKLKDSAAGHAVEGAYITNTTYAYWYMHNNFQAGNWFKLTVRGYLNGQQVADSVDLMLGQVTDSTSAIVNTWTWLDMSALGNVDSLTFDLSSNDTVGGFGMNNPAYFAIDNLTTLDADTTGEDSAGTGIIAAHSVNPEFSISPNPVVDQLNLISDQPLDAAVYDLSGKCILFEKQVRSIDVSRLPGGIYLIKAWDRNHLQTTGLKFVKQ